GAGREATLFQAPHGEVASATPTTAASATNATLAAPASDTRDAAAGRSRRSSGTRRATAATTTLVAQRGRTSKRATSARRRKFAHRTSPMPTTIASRATTLERKGSAVAGSSRATSGPTSTASAIAGPRGAPEKTPAPTSPRTAGDVHAAASAQAFVSSAISAGKHRTSTTSRMAPRGATPAVYHQRR